MKRSTFIKSSILGSIATISLNGIKLNSNPKISLSPWSIMRKGYGEIDPGGIDVYDYPMIAKELGFNYIEHEMFHFPKNLDRSPSGLRALSKMLQKPLLVTRCDLSFSRFPQIKKIKF